MDVRWIEAQRSGDGGIDDRCVALWVPCEEADVLIPDGDLGLAYEFGNYEGIAFVRIARDEVGWDGSAPTLIPLFGTAGAALPPETAG